MPCLRDIAYLVVGDYKGGAASLAPRLGKSPTTLAHEVNGTGQAKLGLLDAERITQLTGDCRILEAFALNAGFTLIPLPSVDGADVGECLGLLAASAGAFGALCSEVGGDVADGRMSDNELARVTRECASMVASVNALLGACGRLNASCKPGGAK